MPYSTEEMRAYMRDYRKRRLDDARQRLGGKCVECSSTADLQFDHIDPATKIKPLTKMLHASIEMWEAELAKCQLLCGDCHQEKHRDRGAPAHGLNAYKTRGCRCEICREAKRRSRRIWA